MASLTNWLRYVNSKLEYSVSLYQKTHGRVDSRSLDTIVKTLLSGKLTFLHHNKEGVLGGTILVRRIPDADPKNINAGDVVVVKDPMDSEKYLVRRLAAIEGDEMVSTDEKDEPFFLEKNECWVLGEKESKKPYDSRSFGPVTMKDIIGRAIYCMRNHVDHGAVNNSDLSMRDDSPVLAMELDVDEMKKNHEQ